MLFLKDNHWENVPSYITETLVESVNMYIWAIGTVNKLFIRGPYTKFSKKKEIVSGKSPFYVIDPFCTPIQFVLKLAFDRAVFDGNVALSCPLRGSVFL